MKLKCLKNILIIITCLGFCTFTTENSTNMVAVLKYKLLDPVIKVACRMTGVGLPKSTLARICTYMLSSGYKFRDVASAAVRYCSTNNVSAQERDFAKELSTLSDSTKLGDLLTLQKFTNLFKTSGSKGASRNGSFADLVQKSLTRNAR